jgi:hypothetical protein
MTKNLISIALSVQDQIDRKGKVGELLGAIGQEFSYNHSSTCRAILLSVSASGNMCEVQEVANTSSFLSHRKPKPGVKQVPSWLVWNSMFS